MNVAAHRVARLCWQQGPHCKHQSIGAQERECVLHNEEGLQSALHPWRRQGYISATGWSGVPQHCVRAGMLAHLRGASVGHIPKAGCHSSCLGHSESPHHTSVSTRPCSLQQQKGKTWGGHHAHDPPSWAHRATQDLMLSPAGSLHGLAPLPIQRILQLDWAGPRSNLHQRSNASVSSAEGRASGRAPSAASLRRRRRRRRAKFCLKLCK